MEKITNKSNIFKYFMVFICLINLNRIIISIQLSRDNAIYDPDLINYYEPVSKNFLDTYFSTKPTLSILSAQVTPLFPLFLRIFTNRSAGLFAYSLLSIVILFLTYKISLKLFTKKIALISILILSIEPAFYASSLNLSPELLFTFAITVGVYFVICKPIPLEFLNYIIFCFAIGASVLIRPIALFLIASFFMFWIIKSISERKYIKLIYAMITITPSLLWSFRNYFVHGFFNVSSISANNLLWYEGVPALAEDMRITYEEASGLESKLRDQSVGQTADVHSTYLYNNARGLELIFNHPVGWLISHLKGAAKLFFGIFKSKYDIIISSIYKIENQNFNRIIFLFLGIVILSIWILFFYGIKSAFLKDNISTSVLLSIIILLLIPASGHIAYARFRVPTSPLLCIFIGYGIQEFLKNNYIGKLRKRI
jgi:4-amino-4-deoxy-L-arabinose transferase-like glycosyltransferase